MEMLYHVMMEVAPFIISTTAPNVCSFELKCSDEHFGCLHDLLNKLPSNELHAFKEREVVLANHSNTRIFMELL